MDISLTDALKALIEPVATISGAAYALYKISAQLKKDREHESAKILQDAKEASFTAKIEMEAKIEALRVKLATLEASVGKDLEHITETHDNKINNLMEKIEALREQLADHHSQLVTFLTKLIDKQ